MTIHNKKTPSSLEVRDRNWTTEDADSFAHKVAFEFIAQIEKTLEDRGIQRSELANNLGVSQSSVSQVLNNPQNLTLKTIARYCRSLGLKAALLAYNDGDPENREGLIGSQVFNLCWEKMGKPRDVWSVNEHEWTRVGTGRSIQVVFNFYCLIQVSFVVSETSVLQSVDPSNEFTIPFFPQHVAQSAAQSYSFLRRDNQEVSENG